MDTKKLSKSKIIYCATIFAVSLFFFGYSSVSAATLRINSSSTSLTPGDTATLYVVLNSEGIAVNNAEATITFPMDLFDVVSISKSGSVFSLWVEEPYFSNSSGVITFNGGVPTPGFNGSQGSVVSMVVRAKKIGQAEFVFSNAAVRANDGLGTDVLNNKQGKTITIVKREESPTSSPTPTPKPSTNLTLKITSPTHVDQNLWYKDRNPTFQWDVPSGVDAIQTSIDSDISGVPRVTYSPAIKEKALKDLEDGVWYFKARARKDGKWGSTSTYIVRIDNTIPEKKDVTFSYDDKNKILSINTLIADETSGLDYYEIYINDILLKKIPSTEFSNGNYNVAFSIPGNNVIRLLTVDRAGNSVESFGSFYTSAIEVSLPTPVESATHNNEQLLLTVGSFSVPVIYIVIIILLVIIILVIAAFYFGRYFSSPRRKSKVSMALVKGDNAKALFLFKKRLEKHLEILQQTRHSRVLSKEEKDIKEAIESYLDEVDQVMEKQWEKDFILPTNSMTPEHLPADVKHEEIRQI